MLESDAEVTALQALLDASMRSAGAHLREVYDGALLSARQLVGRMAGMQLLTVATVTADGRPIAGAVDGYLLHGELWFSSDERALRTRHLRRNSAVSATWLPDDHTQLTVHGSAEIVSFAATSAAPLRTAMLEQYLPTEGPEWARFVDELIASGAPAFRIVPRAAFAYFRPATEPSGS